MGAFTRSSAKETLQKTLQTIVRPGSEKTLYDVQKELSFIETMKIEKNLDLESKKAAYDGLASRLESMSGEVSRMEARKVAAEKLRLYELKKLRLILKDGQNRVQDKQTIYNDAERAFQTALESLQPLEEVARDIKKKLTDKERNVDTTNAKLVVVDKDVSRAKDLIDELDIKVVSAFEEMKAVDSKRASEERKLATTLSDIEEKEVALNKIELHRPVLQQRLDEATASQSVLVRNDQDLADQLNDLTISVRYVDDIVPL